MTLVKSEGLYLISTVTYPCQAWERAVLRLLGDAGIALDREAALLRYARHFELDDAELDRYGMLRQFIQGAAITASAAGLIPHRMTLPYVVAASLGLDRSEQPVWLFGDVEYRLCLPQPDRSATITGAAAAAGTVTYYPPRLFVGHEAPREGWETVATGRMALTSQGLRRNCSDLRGSSAFPTGCGRVAKHGICFASRPRPLKREQLPCVCVARRPTSRCPTARSTAGTLPGRHRRRRAAAQPAGAAGGLSQRRRLVHLQPRPQPGGAGPMTADRYWNLRCGARSLRGFGRLGPEPAGRPAETPHPARFLRPRLRRNPRRGRSARPPSRGPRPWKPVRRSCPWTVEISRCRAQATITRHNHCRIGPAALQPAAASLHSVSKAPSVHCGRAVVRPPHRLQR